jgi:GntR family transcriptional regulator, rspAB operon transcriptional repressor
MPVEAARNDDLDDTQPLGAQLLPLLKGRIVRGELEPGSRLSEASIAAELALSRQPVREAFIKLAEEGLIEVRRWRGTFVRKISARHVEDVRFVREAIEADVVRCVAKAPPPGLERELQDLLQAQAATADVRGFVELDDQFHRTLAAAAGHLHAWTVVESLKAQLDRVRYLSVQRFPKEALIVQHAAVVDAIRRQDAAAAEAAMRQHLRMLCADLPVIARERPAFFTE